MTATLKKSVLQKAHGFTIIELIIVVVIIGILAMVAIPRYFSNIVKSQKAQAWHNLNRIQEAYLAHFAAYGSYPVANVFPIIVTIDGDMIMNIANPNNAIWTYVENENSGNLIEIAYSTNKGYSACRMYKYILDGTVQTDYCTVGP